jgi:hypothetical protein
MQGTDVQLSEARQGRWPGARDVPRSGEEDRRFDDQAWSGAKNAILAEIQPICSDDEFRRYRRMIGQSMGSILLDVINPIVELYPDLKPSHWNKGLESTEGEGWVEQSETHDLVWLIAAR